MIGKNADVLMEKVFQADEKIGCEKSGFLFEIAT
jgi:hypothetical protein